VGHCLNAELRPFGIVIVYRQWLFTSRLLYEDPKLRFTTALELRIIALYEEEIY
jgi:hypothetical protein